MEPQPGCSWLHPRFGTCGGGWWQLSDRAELLAHTAPLLTAGKKPRSSWEVCTGMDCMQTGYGSARALRQPVQLGTAALLGLARASCAWTHKRQQGEQSASLVGAAPQLQCDGAPTACCGRSKTKSGDGLGVGGAGVLPATCWAGHAAPVASCCCALGLRTAPTNGAAALGAARHSTDSRGTGVGRQLQPSKYLRRPAVGRHSQAPAHQENRRPGWPANLPRVRAPGGRCRALQGASHGPPHTCQRRRRCGDSTI